jgi:hypothetical protein
MFPDQQSIWREIWEYKYNDLIQQTQQRVLASNFAFQAETTADASQIS